MNICWIKGAEADWRVASLTPAAGKVALFDHFIRGPEDLRRDCQSKCARGLAIDRDLPPRLLNREIAGARTLDDAIHICGGTPVEFAQILAIAHEPAGLHIVALGGNRWQPMLERDLSQPWLLLQEEQIVRHPDGLDTRARN